MKDFATILRALTRRIRGLQTTDPLPSQPGANERTPSASTRSLYRTETAQWGVDQANEILRRLERRGTDSDPRRESTTGSNPRFPAGARGRGVTSGGRRRPQRSLRSRLVSRRSPTPRGLLN